MHNLGDTWLHLFLGSCMQKLCGLLGIYTVDPAAKDSSDNIMLPGQYHMSYAFIGADLDYFVVFAVCPAAAGHHCLCCRKTRLVSFLSTQVTCKCYSSLFDNMHALEPVKSSLVSTAKLWHATGILMKRPLRLAAHMALHAEQVTEGAVGMLSASQRSLWLWLRLSIAIVTALVTVKNIVDVQEHPLIQPKGRKYTFSAVHVCTALQH